MSDSTYSKLPGRRQGIVLGASLWLGSDHILSVKNVRYAEEYRRFYLREIQALIVRKRVRLVIPSMWLLGMCVSAILALSGLPLHVKPLIYSGSAGLIALAGYLFYVTLFESCVSHVQTAVSQEELPSLYRLWMARKAAEVLSGKIAEVQGTLPEDWDADTEPASQNSLAPASARSAPSARAVQLALASFLLLFVDAGLSYLNAQGIGGNPMRAAGWTATIAVAAVMVAALISIRGNQVLHVARNLIVAGIVLVGFTNYTNYVMEAVIAAVKQTGAAPSLRLLYWINEVGEIGLGAIGLAALAAARRKAAPEEASQP